MSNSKAFAEAILLQQSALVTLYELEATSVGGDLMRFCPATDQNGESIIWQGNTYTSYPVEAKGFEIKSQGQLPRPTISFSNAFGLFSALCIAHRDLVGAKLTRKRTFEKFLDGKPDADPTAALPDDVYYIDRKTSEDKLQVSFELASIMDVDDVTLPRRKIVANLCQWGYRTAECSFRKDKVVSDSLGNPLPRPGHPAQAYQGAYSPSATYNHGDVVEIYRGSFRRLFYCLVNGTTGAENAPPNPLVWDADECTKHVSSGCLPRFPERSGLPFGGFPAVSRLPF